MIRWGVFALAALAIVLAAGATTYTSPGTYALRSGDSVALMGNSATLVIIGQQGSATVALFSFSNGTNSTSLFLQQDQLASAMGVSVHMDFLVFTSVDPRSSYAKVTVSAAPLPTPVPATTTTLAPTTTSTTLPQPTATPVIAPAAPTPVPEPTQTWLDGLIKWIVNVLTHL